MAYHSIADSNQAIAKPVNQLNLPTMCSAKSLMRHENKTIKGRRDISRLTFALFMTIEASQSVDSIVGLVGMFGVTGFERNILSEDSHNVMFCNCLRW